MSSLIKTFSLLTLVLAFVSSAHCSPLQNLNKLLKKSSPYGGHLEIVDGSLIHHQKLNPGKRAIKLESISEIKYLYDRYDPNKAPYSVSIVCNSGNCVNVAWADGESIDYPSMIFSFTSEKDAIKALELFKSLQDSLN